MFLHGTFDSHLLHTTAKEDARIGGKKRNEEKDSVFPCFSLSFGFPLCFVLLCCVCLFIPFFLVSLECFFSSMCVFGPNSVSSSKFLMNERERERERERANL